MRPSLEQAIKAATNNISSIAIDATNILYASAQVVGTGTLTGTVKFQFSNDIVNPQIGPTHWIDVPSATVALTAAGILGIPKFDSCYKWLRVDFSGAAGAGTVSVNVNTIGA